MKLVVSSVVSVVDVCLLGCSIGMLLVCLIRIDVMCLVVIRLVSLMVVVWLVLGLLVNVSNDCLLCLRN